MLMELIGLDDLHQLKKVHLRSHVHVCVLLLKIQINSIVESIIVQTYKSLSSI